MKIKDAKTTISERLLACLREAGFEAGIQESEHETVIYSRRECEDGETLRVVTQLSTREVTPTGSGRVGREFTGVHLAQAVVRPTLGQRSAAAALTEHGPRKVDR